jgi:hypothetical protein
VSNSYLEAARIGTGLVCLLLLMMGVRWQARTFRGDEATGQRRVWSALLIGLASLLGAAIWVIYSLFDPKSTMSAMAGLGYVIGIAALAAAFLIKTWLGPLLVCSVASWTVYMFVAHGQLELLPVFELIVRAAFENPPSGATGIFAALTIAHAAIGSSVTAWTALD